jgi:stage V sporulation protein G
MRITEVQVRLVTGSADRLKAFCSMTFDDEFVVRDIKVIKGTDGYFVAMPSRKMSDHCEACGVKNHLRAKYCNGCGRPLGENRARQEARLHADIAHPINLACRQRIQRQVVTAYKQELERSRQPGYLPLEMDEPDDEIPETMG